MQTRSSLNCSPLLLLLIASCASHPRVQYDPAPPGSLRLGQVVYSGTKAEIQSSGQNYELIRGAGVPEDQIQDGSAMLLRVYCCGGKVEKATAPMVYVPPGLKLEFGDIVEFRTADPKKVGTLEQIHVALRVRHKPGETNGVWRWDPPQEGLWMRVLYADWMRQEGWKYKGGISKGWYKPPQN